MAAESKHLPLIKLAHTAIWALMATAIIAIPIAAMRRRFRLAAWLTALLIAGECIVLALNGGRCPLTDLAARFTAERAANFDIYPPALAREAQQGDLRGIIYYWGVGLAVAVGESRQRVRRRESSI